MKVPLSVPLCMGLLCGSIVSSYGFTFTFTSSSSSIRSTRSMIRSSRRSMTNDNSRYTDSSSSSSDDRSDIMNVLSRREAVRSIAAATVALGITSNPESSHGRYDAASMMSSSSTSTSTPTSKFTAEQIQKFLQPVPTFTIVDSTGTPFMVVGEDAKLSAYFFTTYAEASRILAVASESASRTIRDAVKEENDKRNKAAAGAGGSGTKSMMTKKEIEDEIGINPWIGARVSSVPMDFAVSLAIRGKIQGAFFRVQPSEEDVEEALKLDQDKDDLAEGKVPLFYMDDFEMDAAPSTGTTGGLWSGNTGGKVIPLFFSKKQLLEEWNRNNPKTNANKDDIDTPTPPIPEIKVTELFSLLTSMVQATDQNSDPDLEKLVLVPPRDSAAKAKDCLKKGKGEKPFKLGERIVVL